MTTVFVCEDSLDGILTGVYNAWDSRLGHENVRLRTEAPDTPELFCRYEQVETDPEKAEKVLRTVQRRMGREAGEAVCYAAACTDANRADAIYRLIVRGLSMENGAQALHCLQDPCVLLVMKLRQKAWHEAHRMLGFLRFEEFSGGILYARMEPCCAVLPLIAPHFTDRLFQESFIIHDLKRGQLALHKAGGSWALADAALFEEEALGTLSSKEEEFQKLWRTFCEAVSIEERKNPRCQQNFLPLRFRPCMTEF